MVDLEKLLVKPGTKVDLKQHDTKYTGKYVEDEAKDRLKKNRKKLANLQETFYAADTYSLLIVLQAMDAAGKDGAIRHVMSGVNPQGCAVHSFKKPSSNELEHDFFWRHYKALPERGQIGIFNRSHYENVLITKVHPEYLMGERIPAIRSVKDITPEFWQNRYEQINNFERNINQNGTIILKFFLNVSKEEQKQRFLDRINEPDKNWKFSSGDIEERKYWDDYQEAFEMALSKTSQKHAPWYIVPADNKWFTRIAISDIIIHTLKELNLKIPDLAPKEQEMLGKAKQILTAGD
ncbi:MAG: polyphosphate kinase 2 family protein [Bacteroidales bacterium]|nr:polyphosphate kinase 2 family protein [Bacteroidales bacterium]